MRLSFTALATAAFALLAAAADVTRDLPARFSLETISADPLANGARIRVQLNGSNICFNITGDLWPATDGIFRSGRGRIALDLSAHPNPLGTGAPPAPSVGDWNLGFLPGMSLLQIMSEEKQAWLDGLGPQWHPTVATWVRDAAGTLRLRDQNGVVSANGFRMCGYGVVRWDTTVLNCPEVRLKVVPV